MEKIQEIAILSDKIIEFGGNPVSILKQELSAQVKSSRSPVW